MIKVLLVEDNEEKRKQVLLALASAFEASEGEIAVAKSFLSASKLLSETSFDLLVLDLMLPLRDGEKDTTDGGVKLLAEIFDGECQKPSHIFCLTAYKDLEPSVSDVVARGLAHFIWYDEIDGRWSSAIVTKARYVKSRLEQADRQPTDYAAHALIVTSSPQVELQEVTRLPGGFVAEYSQADALHYFRAEWCSKSSGPIDIIACAAPSMGMTAACVTACKGIERWRPRYLIMTGIAAGTAKAQKYGDILVAESAFDYGSGKILEREDGERVFIPSPKQLSISSNLHSVLQLWEREQRGMDAVWRNARIKADTMPRLQMGLLATGAAVVQSREFVTEILEKSRKVVGLEMEAYAIFQAAALCSSPRPSVLVAKAVSDFADRKKKDHWQEYAAYTSARFVYEFFTTAPELWGRSPI